MKPQPVTMQLKRPLTPALSPSEGARETLRCRAKVSPFRERALTRCVFSLAPSEGERAGVRGRFNCIVTAPFRLAFIIGLLSLLPSAAQAVGTFILAPSRVDIVYDLPRDILYISSRSNVLRYQLSSDTFLSPYTLTGSLMGMELSPDGNKLFVADSSTASSTVWVHVIDLNTGVDTPAVFAAASNESGTFAVAFGGDGAALISSRF